MLSDLHAHSVCSNDGMASPECMYEAAAAKGLSAVALTEHYDFLPPGAPDLCCGDNKKHYDSMSAIAREAVIGEREHNNGRIKAVYAIEIGQPHMDKESSREFLRRNSFDFVLGSVHIARTLEDFYFIPYENADADKLIEEYCEDVCEMLRFGGIDALAHLDYPVRSFCKMKTPFASLEKYKEAFAQVLRLCAQTGVALEINTHGLRNWYNRLTPEIWALRLYRDFGGETVTTGSDAHNECDIGTGIAQARELADSLSLRCVSYYENRKPIFED